MKTNQLFANNHPPINITVDKTRMVQNIIHIFDEMKRTNKEDQMFELLSKYGLEVDGWSKGMALWWQINKWSNLRLEKLQKSMRELLK